jgi:hypothetical protein
VILLALSLCLCRRATDQVVPRMSLPTPKAFLLHVQGRTQYWRSRSRPLPSVSLDDAQAINVDAAACFKHNLAAALASVQYCSDQNSVLVHIKVPEEAAPGAKELPHIPVTLKAASCSDAKADMQAAVAKARVA